MAGVAADALRSSPEPRGVEAGNVSRSRISHEDLPVRVDELLEHRDIRGQIVLVYGPFGGHGGFADQDEGVASLGFRAGQRSEETDPDVPFSRRGVGEGSVDGRVEKDVETVETKRVDQIVELFRGVMRAAVEGRIESGAPRRGRRPRDERHRDEIQSVKAPEQQLGRATLPAVDVQVLVPVLGGSVRDKDTPILKSIWG
jgi:hypothetical protein